ncbi:hypothetical protein NQU49_26940, partial [Escherichia coli]|uniref:hypothetical protein n=1 Tax=Escherichia coli TaxID=562 RepID=UPI0021187B22
RQVEQLGKELLRSGESQRSEKKKNNTQKSTTSKTMSNKTAKLVEKARRRTVDPDEEEVDEDDAELKRAGEDIEAVIAAQAHRIE